MKEEKNTAGRGRSLSRRTFVIIILSVCAIALAAEVALLVHSFTKKETGKKDAPEKPPTPTIEIPEGFQAEWKLLKIFEYSGDGKGYVLASETRYEYDETGALVRTRGLSGGYLYDTEYLREQCFRLRKYSAREAESFESIGEQTERPVSNYVYTKGNLFLELVFFVGASADYSIAYDERGRWKELTANQDYAGCIFEYDERDRLVKETVWRREVTNPKMPVRETIYQYADDSDENWTSVTGMPQDSGGLSDQALMTIREFKDNECVSEKVCYGTNMLMKESTYTYSTKGTLCSTTQYSYNAGNLYAEGKSLTWTPDLPEPFVFDFANEIPVENVTSRLEKDERGNVTAISLVFPTGAERCLCEASYDTSNLLVSYRDKSVERTFRYDSKGNPIEEIEKDLSDGTKWKTVAEYGPVPVRIRE